MLKFYFVFDNSFIHKSQDVKSFIEGSNIRILIISTYSPSLNLIENLILYIKRKLIVMHSRNKYALKTISEELHAYI